MNVWVLILILNTKPVEILEYRHGRDCDNAATAVRLSLKKIDSGTKVEVFCQYREAR